MCMEFKYSCLGASHVFWVKIEVKDGYRQPDLLVHKILVIDTYVVLETIRLANGN